MQRATQHAARVGAAWAAGARGSAPVGALVGPDFAGRWRGAGGVVGGVGSSRSLHAGSVARMPVKFDDTLDAFKALGEEGVWVESMQKHKAEHMEGHLRIGIVNLMPLKEPTELQLLRMLGRSAIMAEVTFIVPDQYIGKNCKPGYLDAHYKRFSEVRDEKFDGYILTGAPIEHLPFEKVGYWNELQEFFELVEKQEAGLLSLCWGAMASLYHFHQIPKHDVHPKLFGVFQHVVTRPTSIMMLGLPAATGVPVSRHTTWKFEDFEGKKGCEVLLVSPDTGPACVWDHDKCHVHMINHFEYDVDTLAGEYERDLAKGTPTGDPIHIPWNYYPNDDPTRTPEHTWLSSGQVFYSNWLSALVRKRYYSQKTGKRKE